MVMLKFPTGLVASSDGEVRRNIAEIPRQCGLPSVVASTVAESGIALAGHEVSIVLCNDCLADGNYEDIVKLVGRSDKNLPVIVVSRTGDRPEFLAAIRSGAFDYLAYPPFPGSFNASSEMPCWGTNGNGASAVPECSNSRPGRRKDMRVLLVGETARSSLQLLQWLNNRGCRCQLAQSYRDACNLVSRAQFDLVLSQYQLPDRTAFPLLDWLAGSRRDSIFLRTRRARLFMVKDARTRQGMCRCTIIAVE